MVMAPEAECAALGHWSVDRYDAQAKEYAADAG
jgi:hypothetical protein